MAKTISTGAPGFDKSAAAKSVPASLKRARKASYPPGMLRSSLVAEGRKMFEEMGPTELSMRKLAARLGVSEAAPSKHFSGKEELLAAIASDGFRELAAQREALSRKRLPPLEKARQMMLSYVRFACTHEGLFDLMIGPRVLPQFRSGELAETTEKSYAYFSNSIFALGVAHGWSKDSLEYLAHAAWGMEHGIAALILARRIPREHSKLELQATIEFAVDFFLASIVNGAPEKLKRTPKKPKPRKPKSD